MLSEISVSWHVKCINLFCILLQIMCLWRSGCMFCFMKCLSRHFVLSCKFSLVILNFLINMSPGLFAIVWGSVWKHTRCFSIKFLAVDYGFMTRHIVFNIPLLFLSTFAMKSLSKKKKTLKGLYLIMLNRESMAMPVWILWLGIAVRSISFNFYIWFSLKVKIKIF